MTNGGPPGLLGSLRYFERLVRESADPRWTFGVDLCHEWVSLGSHPTPAEVVRFSTRLHDAIHLGSGFYDLELKFRAWSIVNRFLG